MAARKKYDYSKVVELLNQGFTRREVSTKLKIRYGQLCFFVRRYEEKHGVSFKWNHVTPHKKIDCSMAIDLLRNGYTRREASRILGVRYEHVQRWVKAYEDKHREVFEYDWSNGQTSPYGKGERIEPWKIIGRHTPIGFTRFGVYEIEK